MKTIFLFLVFFILGNFFPTTGATEENMSFSEMVAKRQALQAEQDALGQQWQANQEKLDNLGVQYEALDVQITQGIGRLGQLKAEAETLIRDYERKLPELERREIPLNARERELEQDHSRYSAHCNVTVPDEEYAALSAYCEAWYARYSSAWTKLGQDFDQLDREARTLEDTTNRAIETHDNLLGEFQTMEAKQQSLVNEGTALERASKEFVQKGRELENQILELDLLIAEKQESPCRPGDFRTAEAFEECMRTIFDGGGGIKVPPPTSPIDMSPTDERDPNPFDLDPSVVKPDWEEDPDG
jgi:chromosome segregation ATPase